MSNGLLSDLASRITKKKTIGDVDYALYDAYPDSGKAHQKRSELIKWSRRQTQPALSQRIKPIVYDTIWKGKKRYKLYIPTRWMVHNV